MELDIQMILGVVTAILIPAVAYYFKKFENKFEEHDKRMDCIEVNYQTREDAQTESQRVNTVFKEVFNNKADKDLVQAMVEK